MIAVFYYQRAIHTAAETDMPPGARLIARSTDQFEAMLYQAQAEAELERGVVHLIDGTKRNATWLDTWVVTANAQGDLFLRFEFEVQDGEYLVSARIPDQTEAEAQFAAIQQIGIRWIQCGTEYQSEIPLFKPIVSNNQSLGWLTLAEAEQATNCHTLPDRLSYRRWLDRVADICWSELQTPIRNLLSEEDLRLAYERGFSPQEAIEQTYLFLEGELV